MQFLFTQNILHYLINFAEIKAVDIDNTFEQINSALSSDKSFIRDEWIDFSKTILRLKATHNKDIVRSTADASLYFNNDIISSHIEMDMFLSVSGYLTGLGILGTFFGLMYGLAGIDMSNADKINHGIVSMLSGVGTAFSTSLWGIICATLFSYSLKKKNIVLEKLVSQLQKNINSKFQNVSAEYYLSQIPAILSEQSAQLKKFNTEVALGIAEAIDERMEKNMQPTVELMAQISSTLKKQTDQLQMLNNDMAKNIATMINKQLSDSLTLVLNELGKIPSILGEQSSQLKKFNTEAAASIAEAIDERMEKNMQPTVGLMAQISSTLKKQTDELEKLNSDMAKSIAAIIDEKLSGTLHPTINALMSEIKKLNISGASTIADTITSGIGQELNSFAEVLKKTSDNLSRSSDETRMLIMNMNDSFASSSEKISEMLNKAAEMQLTVSQSIFDKLAYTSEELKKQNEQNSSNLTEFTSNMLEKLQTITSETLNRSSNETNKLIASINDKFTESSAKVSGMLSETAETQSAVFNDIIQKLCDATEELKKQSEKQKSDIVGFTDNMIKQLETVSADFTAMHVKSANNISQTFSGLEALTKELKEILTVAADTADKFSDASNPVFESAENLRNAVSEFKETQETITTSTQKMAISVKDASALYASNVDQLQKLSISIRGTVDLYKSSLQNVNIELDREFSSLTRSMQHYNAVAVQGLQDYLVAYETKTNAAITSLNSSVQGMEALTESIEHSLSKLDKRN